MDIDTDEVPKHALAIEVNAGQGPAPSSPASPMSLGGPDSPAHEEEETGNDEASDEEDLGSKNHPSALDLEFGNEYVAIDMQDLDDDEEDLAEQQGKLKLALLRLNCFLTTITDQDPPMFMNPLTRFMAVFLLLFQRLFTGGRGVAILISFFNILLASLGQQYRFPSTVKTLRKHTGLEALTGHVRRYAVCLSCYSIYGQSSGQTPTPQCCTFVRFPNHPVETRRQPCSTPLFQVNAYGVRAKQPIKEFPYNSVIKNLEVTFQRPGFEKQILQWKDRKNTTGALYDIYDGAMWTELKYPVAGTPPKPFAEYARSLHFTLNVDWFKPFKNSQYSCGALYLVINNLPRAERFKPENIILVGVMPGRSEPKLTEEMNHYLEPLVDELLILYNGVEISTFEQQLARSYEKP